MTSETLPDARPLTNVWPVVPVVGSSVTRFTGAASGMALIARMRTFVSSVRILRSSVVLTVYTCGAVGVPATTYVVLVSGARSNTAEATGLAFVAIGSGQVVPASQAG